MRGCSFPGPKIGTWECILPSSSPLESAWDLCHIFQGASKILPAEITRESLRCVVFLHSLDA
jgi:hypothetical protein